MSGISNDALLIANAIKEAGNTVAAAIEKISITNVTVSMEETKEIVETNSPHPDDFKN